MLEIPWKPDWVGENGGGGGANQAHRGLKVDNPFAKAAASGGANHAKL